MGEIKLNKEINGIQNGDLRYEYNTKYKSRLDKYDESFYINVSESSDYQKIYKVFGIDESKIPDKYDIKVLKLIPCKWHKKKRMDWGKWIYKGNV